jgi:FG-GAP repeat
MYSPGKAWVYRQHGSEWRIARPIADDDGHSDDYFGYGIAIDGHEVIIGSHRKNDNAGKVFFVNLE